jgi:Tfp pilus assembly protein PilO
MKIENRRKFLIGLTLAVLALYAADWLVFEPLVKWWKSREAAVVELRRQVNDGKFLIQHQEDIRNRWAQMQTNALPDNTSLAEQQVLNAFDNWSRQSGASITSVTPQWQNDQDDYSTLDCHVEASGDLETLSRFLYCIENDPMALKIESLDLSAQDDKGQELVLGLQISGLALISQQP